MARTIEEAEAIIMLYEQNGATKLFYALNRKMNEMGDMLNKQSLTNLDLTDPKDKSFERIKAIWESAEKVSLAVKSLADIAGITGDENVDINKKTYRTRTTPETIADVLANT